MDLSQVKSKTEQFCFLGPDILNELKKLCVVVNALFLDDVEGVPEALALQLEYQGAYQ